MAQGGTDEGPIPRAGNSQRLALNSPSTVQAQRRQPYSISRVRARITSISSQIQTFDEMIVGYWVVRRARPLVLRVERPGAARNRQVSARRNEGRQNRRPRRQFVGMVCDDEHSRLEVGMIQKGFGWVKRFHVQAALCCLRVVGP